MARLCAALAVLGLAACAQQPQQEATYPVNVPAATAQPAESAPPETAPAPAAPVAAPKPVQVRQEVPLRYVVKKGDTLWGIANHFLIDPWQWPEIWYVNDKVRNPHLIYPGDVLTLVNVKGRPALIQGEMDTKIEAFEGPVVKLAPNTRIGNLNDAIPAIPIEVIRDFLNSARVVTPEEMAKAPYLVTFIDPQVIGGAGSEAYFKGIKQDDPSTFNLVRAGETYRDPDSGEILGYEAIPVGSVEVSNSQLSLPTGKLVRTSREARSGDRLLPLEKESIDAFFYPKAPSKPIHARIISVLDGVTLVTQYEIVTLNRGSDAGLERGDVLTIKQTGRVARDPYTATSSGQLVLPDLEAGTLMVFKTTPKISYALVMRATRAIHRLDRAENPTP